MSAQRPLGVFLGLIVVAAALVAGTVGLLSGTGQAAPKPAPAVSHNPPQIIVQRLQVTYLGQDGATYIGSGCPGDDGKGSLIDLHFTVSGLAADQAVSRIIVAGDRSTVTWEWPCLSAWGLYAIDQGEGSWDVYVAPSEAASVYTLLFFYENGSMAMGMVQVP